MPETRAPVVEWLMARAGRRQALLPVPRSFFDDDFNTAELQHATRRHAEALALLLLRPDRRGPRVGSTASFSSTSPASDVSDSSEEADDEHRAVSSLVAQQPADVRDALGRVLDVLHQRYVLTRPGQHAMHARWSASAWGACPRVLCDAFPLLPRGRATTPGACHLELYCARCRECYAPAHTEAPAPWSRGVRAAVCVVDGAAYGPTAAHLLLMQYAPTLASYAPAQRYVPRLFGFRLRADPLPESERDALLALLPRAYV